MYNNIDLMQNQHLAQAEPMHSPSMPHKRHRYAEPTSSRSLAEVDPPQGKKKREKTKPTTQSRATGRDLLHKTSVHTASQRPSRSTR